MRLEKDNDAPPPPPEFRILQALPEIVPNPPVKPRPTDQIEQYPAYVPTWKTWIAEHRAELSLLQPTGEGVDLSPSRCKDGKVPERRR